MVALAQTVEALDERIATSPAYVAKARSPGSLACLCA